MQTKLELQQLERIRALEKELKELKAQSPPMVTGPGLRVFLLPFRAFARAQLRMRGYSAEQAKRMVGKLGDGKILELLKTWGPVFLKIFLAILPFLLAMEPAPEGQPINRIDLESDLALDALEQDADADHQPV